MQTVVGPIYKLTALSETQDNLFCVKSSLIELLIQGAFSILCFNHCRDSKIW